jgi:hypothetical protein
MAGNRWVYSSDGDRTLLELTITIDGKSYSSKYSLYGAISGLNQFNKACMWRSSPTMSPLTYVGPDDGHHRGII